MCGPPRGETRKKLSLFKKERNMRASVGKKEKKKKGNSKPVLGKQKTMKELGPNGPRRSKKGERGKRLRKSVGEKRDFDTKKEGMGGGSYPRKNAREAARQKRRGRKNMYPKRRKTDGPSKSSNPTKGR